MRRRASPSAGAEEETPRDIRQTRASGAVESYAEVAARLRREERQKRKEELRRLEEQEREQQRKREEMQRQRKAQRDAEVARRLEELNNRIDQRALGALGEGDAKGDGLEGVAGDEVREMIVMLRTQVEQLKNREQGQNEVKAQLSAEVERLRAEVKDLNDTLAVYRSPSARKLALAKTPVVADAVLPAAAQTLPKVAVGDVVLAEFSSNEYLVGHAIEENADTFVVRLETGDESEVSKEKVFPPLATIVDVLADTARKEAQIRQTYAEMEAAYKAEVAGLTQELKAAREDYKRMKAVYGVDVRDMLLKRAEKNRPPPKKSKVASAFGDEEDEDEDKEKDDEEEDSENEDEDEDELDEEEEFENDLACNELVRPYSLECEVACYAARVDEVEENRRGNTRWYTAQGQEPDFWNRLSDSVDEVTQPLPICHGRRARLFQLYHDGDTDELELYQARTLCERDLDPHRVSIIDTFSEIWVYVGADATPEAEVEGTQAALGLAEHANDGRSPTAPVVVVRQGKEPLRFRACFGNWTLAPPKASSSSDAAAPADAAAAEGTGAAAAEAAKEEEEEVHCLSYEQLLDREHLPDDVDVTQLETYLSDDEFERVFGMRRCIYVALPEWRQTELRIKNRLF